MKNAYKLILAAAAFAAVVLFAPALVHAQEAAPAVAEASAVATPSAAGASEVAKPDAIAETVGGIAAKYPILITILTVIGALRTVFKPLVSWYEARVAATADEADDVRLAAWKTSWWFKLIAWGLDFTASIKVGPQR